MKGLYGLRQGGKIWNERFKADMAVLGLLHCQRDHAVFRIGDWGAAVSAFCVDDETGVGSRQQLERVSRVFSRKCGISREGEAP